MKNNNAALFAGRCTPEIVALELGTLAKEFEASIKAPRIVARRE
jgi:hypothetical protein